MLALKVRSLSGQLVRVSELVSRRDEVAPSYIMHKNMQPMVMVVADMGGHTDSPLYGMFAASADIDLPQYYVQQPDKLGEVALLWDGSGRSPTRPSATWVSPTEWG